MIQVEQLPDGDAAIYRTAEHMVKLIRAESNTYFVRQCAESVILGVEARDKMGEVKAAFAFVKDNIRYTGDMIGMEYIQTPTYILTMLMNNQTVMGDCDDSTTLLLSLLRSLGFMVRVKITGYNGSDEFTHVYGEVWIENRWVPVDTIVPDFSVGDEALHISRSRVYEV